MTRQTVRTMLRATASGAQRWYHVIFAEQPCPSRCFSNRVVGLGWARPSTAPRSVWSRRKNSVLPRPLEVGRDRDHRDSTLLVDLGGAGHTYFHHIDRRMSEVVDLGAVRPRGPAARAACRPCKPWRSPPWRLAMHLGGLDSVHVAARSFGPGRVGLTWEW